MIKATSKDPNAIKPVWTSKDTETETELRGRMRADNVNPDDYTFQTETSETVEPLLITYSMSLSAAMMEVIKYFENMPNTQVQEDLV